MHSFLYTSEICLINSKTLSIIWYNCTSQYETHAKNSYYTKHEYTKSLIYVHNYSTICKFKSKKRGVYNVM